MKKKKLHCVGCKKNIEVTPKKVKGIGWTYPMLCSSCGDLLIPLKESK